MDESLASQIADLINEQNQLAIRYTAKRVLDHASDYLYVLEAGRLVACAEVKAVQWYQAEVLHVSVHPDWARQGKGTQMVQLAMARGRELRARLLQCTIRQGNEASLRLFRKAGFVPVARFHNARTHNNVEAWQYVLSSPVDSPS